MTQTAKTADVVTDGAWKLNPATGEEIIADGECIVLARVPSAKSGLYNRRAPANARLIVSACNSYKRHCTDPVSAAEGDLLGRCVEALRKVSAVRSTNWNDDDDPDMVEAYNAVDAILSQVREVRS